MLVFLTACDRKQAASPTEATIGGKPNIVFILTDDMASGDEAYMPHLQSLVVAQGTHFSSYYISFPSCCPSRASTLRGQYAQNTGIMSNLNPTGGFFRFRDRGEEASTVATWLQSAGYRTVLLGKYLNQYGEDGDSTYVPAGWSEWDAFLVAHDEGGAYFNYALNLNKSVKLYGSGAKDYSTDVLAGRAVDFIRRMGSQGNPAAPFFMWLAPFAPHTPVTPSPRYAGRFAGYQAPRTPSFNLADSSEIPYFRGLPPLTSAEIAAIDLEYQHRLETLQSVDDMVDSVVTALAAIHALQNTYIFFSSDNGYHMGQHRLLAGKEQPYEEDVKVPLYVRGPGVPVRTVSDLAVNIDLAPTFAELSDAAAASFVDGRSLATIVNGGPTPQPWRKGLLVQTTIISPNGNADLAVRSADYTYVRRYSSEHEFYDMRVDPYQIKNIYTTTPTPITEAFRVWMLQLWACKASTCRDAENNPPVGIP